MLGHISCVSAVCGGSVTSQASILRKGWMDHSLPVPFFCMVCGDQLDQAFDPPFTEVVPYPRLHPSGC